MQSSQCNLRIWGSGLVGLLAWLGWGGLGCAGWFGWLGGWLGGWAALAWWISILAPPRFSWLLLSWLLLLSNIGPTLTPNGFS